MEINLQTYFVYIFTIINYYYKKKNTKKLLFLLKFKMSEKCVICQNCQNANLKPGIKII